MAESTPPKVTTAVLDRINRVVADQRNDPIPTLTVDEACAAVAAASASAGSADEALKQAERDHADANLALSRARAALRKATELRIEEMA